MASSLTGEIIHFGSVRMRVTGAGNLQMDLFSLDSVNTVALTPTVLQSTTNREPTTLTNFNEQRAYLHGYTQEIDETFVISKIIIHIRPVASGYPQ